MRDEPKYNPLSREFETAAVGEVGSACVALSFELRCKGSVRTSDERLTLAERCAEALFRAGKLLTPSKHDASSPEGSVDGGHKVSEAFMHWYLQQVRALRFMAVRRACLAALGDAGMKWMAGCYDSSKYGGLPGFETSDELLATALQELGRDALTSTERNAT